MPQRPPAPTSQAAVQRVAHELVAYLETPRPLADLYLWGETKGLSGYHLRTLVRCLLAAQWLTATEDADPLPDWTVLAAAISVLSPGPAAAPVPSAPPSAWRDAAVTTPATPPPALHHAIVTPPPHSEDPIPMIDLTESANEPLPDEPPRQSDGKRARGVALQIALDALASGPKTAAELGEVLGQQPQHGRAAAKRLIARGLVKKNKDGSYERTKAAAKAAKGRQASPTKAAALTPEPQATRKTKAAPSPGPARVGDLQVEALKAAIVALPLPDQIALLAQLRPLLVAAEAYEAARAKLATRA